MSSRTYLACLLAFAAFACGGKSLDSVGGDAGDGGPEPGPASGCPQVAPGIGDSCSKLQLQCEYGGDPRSACNDVWTCTSMGWDTTFGNDPHCPSSNAGSCPASIAGLDVGGTCGDSGAICDYSTSSASRWCACTFLGGPIMMDGGGSQYTWQCAYQASSGCPALRPRLGTVCTQADLECDYSVCGAPYGLSVQCNGTTGTWVTGFGSVCAGGN
ncbi:MAG TPA: hypothetical protein VF316_09130 [Polyangiaceae bacterium]